eukprot:364962-Chlamydomonas_euryale.AAC.3
MAGVAHLNTVPDDAWQRMRGAERPATTGRSSTRTHASCHRQGLAPPPCHTPALQPTHQQRRYKASRRGLAARCQKARSAVGVETSRGSPHSPSAGVDASTRGPDCSSIGSPPQGVAATDGGGGADGQRRVVDPRFHAEADGGIMGEACVHAGLRRLVLVGAWPRACAWAHKCEPTCACAREGGSGGCGVRGRVAAAAAACVQRAPGSTVL